MARRLRTAVAVHTPRGTVWLSAGQSPEEDVAALITAPDAWDEEPAPTPVTAPAPSRPAEVDSGDELVADPDTATEPPRSGRGSGLDSWRAYAQALGLDVDPDMTRDEIIAAVDNH